VYQPRKASPLTRFAPPGFASVRAEHLRQLSDSCLRPDHRLLRLAAISASGSASSSSRWRGTTPSHPDRPPDLGRLPAGAHLSQDLTVRSGPHRTLASRRGLSGFTKRADTNSLRSVPRIPHDLRISAARHGRGEQARNARQQRRRRHRRLRHGGRDAYEG